MIVYWYDPLSAEERRDLITLATQNGLPIGAKTASYYKDNIDVRYSLIIVFSDDLSAKIQTPEFSGVNEKNPITKEKFIWMIENYKLQEMLEMIDGNL